MDPGDPMPSERDLVKRFGQMREMMAALGGGGAGGLLGKIPGMGRLAAVARTRSPLATAATAAIHARAALSTARSRA